MKSAIVCGAGGFIGNHLVRRLKLDDYWVRAVDLNVPEFSVSDADEFVEVDLRDRVDCGEALTIGKPVDEVYQLAADMGGMGFIHASECEIMQNSALVNLNMIEAAASMGVPRYFLSSSVCVYRNMELNESPLDEAAAYPAQPDNEYGWEKLYAERVAEAYRRKHGIGVRIARFENCYGPYGTWTGGREKAPAAICRKVAEAPDCGRVDVWGDGTAVRSYTYVDDIVDGIVRLMRSELEGPVNIGSAQYVTVQELVDTIMNIAGKQLDVRWVEGPVGVRSRNFSHTRIESLGWQMNYSLHDGISLTYPWIAEQVERRGVEIV